MDHKNPEVVPNTTLPLGSCGFSRFFTNPLTLDWKTTFSKEAVN